MYVFVCLCLCLFVHVHNYDNKLCVYVLMHLNFIQTCFMHLHMHTGNPSVRMEPEEVELTSGNNVTLTCVDHNGFPDPEFTWRHDGEEIPQDTSIISFVGSNTSILHIESVQASDRGTYTCTAENDAGMSSDSSPVEVLCKIIFKKNP